MYVCVWLCVCVCVCVCSCVCVGGGGGGDIVCVCVYCIIIIILMLITITIVGTLPMIPLRILSSSVFAFLAYMVLDLKKGYTESFFYLTVFAFGIAAQQLIEVVATGKYHYYQYHYHYLY